MRDMIWMRSVHFVDGTREDVDVNGVDFIQATAFGVRISKDDSLVRIYPWHTVRLVVEEDD